MRNKICILRKTQVLTDKDQLNRLLSMANEAFEVENFPLAESLLLKASELEDISTEEQAAVFNRIAGLFCLQGMYASATKYYQRFLQLKALHFDSYDTEMQNLIEIYKALRALCRTESTEVQQEQSCEVA